MKPMKTIRLAEIFKPLIHLPKLFMMDFTAQNAVKFIKMQLLFCCVRSLCTTWALFILISKNGPFGSLPFLKNHTFSIKVINVTKQLEYSD